MTARDFEKRLEAYAGSPLITMADICRMVGDKNATRVAKKYRLYDLPKFGKRYACMDVAERMFESRKVVRT